jgi:hypothetical protein
MTLLGRKKTNCCSAICPPLGRLSLLLLQFVHAVQATEPAQLTRRWRGLFRALWLEPLTRGHLLALFSYLGRRLEAPPESLRTAAAVIDTEAETMGKTIAEQLIQQGLQQGLHQGERAGLQEGRAGALRDCIRMLLAARSSQPAAAKRIDIADVSTLECWLPRLIAGEDLDQIVGEIR